MQLAEGSQLIFIAMMNNQPENNEEFIRRYDGKDNIKQKGFKWLKRATKEDLMYDGSFHQAVAPVLPLGKIIAILPVQGIQSNNAASLSFKWCSFATLYCISFFIVQSIYLYMALHRFAAENFPFLDSDAVIFYTSIFLMSICFFNLARKWPDIIKRWNDVEVHLLEHQSQLRRAALAHKYKMFLLIFISLSMLEHTISMLVTIHVVNYCNPNVEPIENFFKIYLFHLFSVTEFSSPKAFIGIFVNTIGTLVWSYTDLFIVVVSEGITDKFRLMNENLYRVKGKKVPEKFWYIHREHYRRISELCEEVDAAISGITLISLSNTLFFICLQLLKSMKLSNAFYIQYNIVILFICLLILCIGEGHPCSKPSFIHNFYFWCSMLFLFFRIATVSLYTTEINEESKKALTILRRIPKEGWCLEAKRFSQEVSGDTVALTGMRFFHLTRPLLCSVAGAIVTYEVVLIQFNVQLAVADQCLRN